MTAGSTRRRTRTLRRRLFVSHLVVMAVAMLVFGFVVGLLSAIGGWHWIGFGKRGDGGGPVVFWMGVGAAATASGLVSWRMTRRIADPLDDVGAATRELAAGRYDVRVPSADTTELAALADDVNQLAHELETTEERRLRLIGDVAHELRNPLSTIEGTMEALLDGVVPATDDTYARIGREAARLRRLADDLSSLSSAGEFSVVGEDMVDVDAMVTDLVAQLEPQATAKKLTMSVDGVIGRPVRGDRDRLVQVLTNVVGNAVQYTDRGGVSVRLSNDAGHAVIDVIDTGRGLSSDDQIRIFERFHRVDERFNDGTGVGLAIAQLIVEAHGGRISAASAGLGRGTTVRIAVPFPA